MTTDDEWDDGPTLDDGLGRGTVRPAPLPALAPGWERVATPAWCTNVLGVGLRRSVCGIAALYANRKDDRWSCEACADLCGVFVPTGDDGGRSP